MPETTHYIQQLVNFGVLHGCSYTINFSFLRVRCYCQGKPRHPHATSSCPGTSEQCGCSWRAVAVGSCSAFSARVYR